MVAIAIVTKSTTVRETATMTPVAAAEAQEAIIEAGVKASVAEEIQIVKAVEENLVSIGTTDLLRVLVEAEDVAAIIRESHATIIHVDDTVKVAHQTGFDIH